MDGEGVPGTYEPTRKLLRCPSCGEPHLSHTSCLGLPEEVSAALREPARSLGRFAKVRLLGEGGMGEVWLGWEKDLRRHVALKFLRTPSKEDAARLLREARMAANVEHPNIIPVYEVTDDFIVMKYVPGVTLDRATLTLRQKLESVRDAAEALQYAHERGVVHRDLKPANLMLDGAHVYVMDFGLARNVSVDASLTLPGTIVGTPAYMPPEQAAGKTCDARSDIYSLGATLYALVCGCPAFQDSDLMALLRRVSEEEPVAPRKIDPSIPWEVETIVLKAMEKEPGGRYATAGELAGDLRRYLEGEPIRAMRPSVGYRIRKRFAKHRWVTIAAGTAFAVALAFAAYVGGKEWVRRARFDTALKEARSEEDARRWDQAMAAYERALTLAPQDSAVRSKRDEMRRRLEEERIALERAKAIGDAELVYERTGRELVLLRLRTYRKEYRLTPREYGEYEKLVEATRRQMEQTGESAHGWWVIGSVRHVLGDWEGAEQAFRAGLAVDRTHGLCRLSLSRLLGEQALGDRFTIGGSRSRALDRMAEARRLLEQESASGTLPELELDLIRGYEKVVTSEDVRDYAERMLEKWRGHDFCEEFHLLRGLGEPDHMEVSATRMIEARPSAYEGYFWRGTVRKDARQAVEDYSRALEINPRHAPSYRNRGDALIRLGEYSAAIDDFTKVIELHPRGGAILDRGRVRHALGDVKGAIEDFESRIRMDPDDPNAYFCRGVARRQIGDLTGSYEDLSSAIDLNPRFAGAYATRGETRRAWRDLQGALEDCAKALDIDPKSADAYTSRGNVRQDQGDFPRAIEDHSKAIEIEPLHMEAHSNRGRARHAMGDFAGAIEDHSKAIELGPRQAKSYFNRGAARQEAGDTNGALEDYERAIEIDPRYASPYINRGNVRKDSGDLKGALDDYAKAIEIEPGIPEVWANRAMARVTLAKREPDRAREHFEAAERDLIDALELAPESWPHRKAVEGQLQTVRDKLGK